MYNFVDVNEASEGYILPSEALKINGEYIENQISGYRTLHVSGREALSPELTTYETGVRDGSVLQSKRYPARTIVVTYQLIAADAEAFRAAYNKLGSILNVEEAELIFNDEPDKFFTGTPSVIGEVEPGLNAVVGEFEILCVDPFKYSVEEYEAEPQTLKDGSFGFLVNYNGTHKAFPKLEASFFDERAAGTITGAGDCGYVAFFNSDGKIIQLGDPDETDGVDDLKPAQTLIDKTFQKSNSWDSSAQSQWVLNKGVVHEPHLMYQGGSVGLVLPAPSYSQTEYYLKCTNYGSAQTTWYGATISRSIPADAAGDVGAKNWAFSYRQKLSIGNNTNSTKEKGGFQAVVSDANGKIIAGVYVYKSGVGKQGEVRPYVNGVLKERIKIDFSYNNKYFGNNKAGLVTVKTTKITKSGSKITFDIGGIKRSYVCAEIADAVATKITFMFTRTSSFNPLSYNGIYWAKFVKNNCDTWREVPNKFSSADVVSADCRTGEILLNDSPSPELGALGNDWDDFFLLPGVNQIGVSYSDFVSDDYAPTFKMRYRGVFM